MPYAANEQISQDPITGGIEITDAEYRQALDGIMNGLMVQVVNGVMSLVEPPTESTTYWLAPADEHQTEPGEELPEGAVTVPPPDEFHIIDGGQWVYSLDRERETMVANSWQVRSVLDTNGLLSDVEGLMADPNTPRQARLMWLYKDKFSRTHPVMEQMATALGWTDTQLDDLFRQAREIEP